jgi:beta-N-acetylhexosaminidase
MEGARRIGGRVVSHAQAAMAALAAGCDMVLLCNQSQGGGVALDALLDELAAAAASGDWLADETSEARRIALLPTAPPLAWDELMHNPAYLHSLQRLP